MAARQATLRFWILAVALASFVTGMIAGSALPEMMAKGSPTEAPEQFTRDLVRKYGLSAEQERLLRMVLAEDRRVELEILRNADWSQLPPELQNQRLAAMRRTQQRIRFVLDPEQRALYDRDSRPQAAAGSPAAGGQENR